MRNVGPDSIMNEWDLTFGFVCVCGSKGRRKGNGWEAICICPHQKKGQKVLRNNFNEIKC